MRLALLAVVAAATASGPAILHIHTVAHGDQFVPFSSFDRCEVFRRQLNADFDRRTRQMLGIKDPSRPTPQPLAGTGSSLQCVPG